MVAISLYRGNLHRVPDTPRRWLMPNHKISIRNFKTLLSRRSKSLRSSTTSNPNFKSEEIKDEVKKEEDGQVKDFEVKELDGGDLKEKKGVEEVVKGQIQGEKDVNPNLETIENLEPSSEKEKRMREVEEKLQVLSAKKHDLVQVLKLILNAEEEVKRRNSTQGLSSQPSIPLQVDVSNDNGVMARHSTPRTGSEANLGGEMEGIETDDASNHHMNSRHLLRTSSISPSSDSPHRRHTVPHPSRASLGATISPSRFASAGIQGYPANLPSVSVPGTTYIASSPSPAASGGTSAFRDTRLPSPWN